MPPRIGYLLPTREQVMEGRPEAAPLLALAERAEGLGYNSIWVGDSITGAAAARAADPAVGRGGAHQAGRARHRGAAAGAAQPGRAGARHRDAGPDQRGPLHPRASASPATCRTSAPSSSPAACRSKSASGACWKGCASARELWTGEPVTWNGRWVMENVTLGPVPHRPGGPPIWIGGMVRASLERVGRLYDGWFPNAPDPERWRAQWAEIHEIAREAGRDPGAADRRGLPDPDDRRRQGARRGADERLHRELLRPPGRRDAGPAGDLCRPGRGCGGMAVRAGRGPGRAIWCCASPATTSVTSTRSPGCAARSPAENHRGRAEHRVYVRLQTGPSFTKCPSSSPTVVIDRQKLH